MNSKTGLFVLLVFLVQACGLKEHRSSSPPLSHDLWNQLVSQHVSPEGQVRYEGFIKDSLQLNAYLNLLKTNHPNDQNWKQDEQIAYWINAYNAFTVKLIVDHYPVKSIKDIKRGIPFINSVWDIKFINIEGAIYDLNNIEHRILRSDKYKEPRIHFAINCASVSCPKLRNEAFTASQLEMQLTDQARSFLSNPIKNKITKDHYQVSKIFSWFKKDFVREGSLIDFLNQYASVQIDKGAKKDFLDYNWNLNN